MLAPALGESYAHAATTRVALSWGEEGTRIAYVAKSPRLANRKAMYTITRDGVRDVVHAASKRKKSPKAAAPNETTHRIQCGLYTIK